jgi:beta-1,4-mannosyl-glycoprotein beta-1,4-N-acetylglucosaminyltransferase|tara:strand:- start:5874 stop:6743 length:870 start_codon:yes stop_codon:yes gene_type:complete
MYFDEDLLLDIRLNVLNSYVTKFIITEATYTHNGSPKKLKFDINNFKKFKDKIEYIVVDNQPPNILEISKDDSLEKKGQKLILNGYARDNYQRNKLEDGILKADDNDLIIVSDLDEIPNLKNVNFNSIKNKLIQFKQKMFYYKLNLYYPEFDWFGSKACRKKHLISPQWLRNIKSKKYSRLRLDLIFNKKKYSDIFYVLNGGWHFTCIRTPEDLEHKLKNFAHHYEYEESGLKIEDLKKLISEKRVMYDHNVDQTGYKWSGKSKLIKVSDSELPEYICLNKKNFKEWLD